MNDIKEHVTFYRSDIMHEYCMGLQKYSPTLGITRKQETFKKVYANSFEEALVKWSKLTGEKILGWDLHLLYTTDFNAYFQIIQERIMRFE